MKNLEASLFVRLKENYIDGLDLAFSYLPFYSIYHYCYLVNIKNLDDPTV